MFNLTWLIMISSVYHVIKYFKNKMAFSSKKNWQKLSNLASLL